MASLTTLATPLSPSASPNIEVPKFIYGTAWKKERTAELVYQAIRAGFRAIDTAAQPKHYDEKGVGDGIRRAIEEGIVKREELFIQTKYTPPSGQDPNNMPYTPSSPIDIQIHTSLASSLTNFTISSTAPPYIDSLVLHSPLQTPELNLLAWSTLSTYVPDRIRSLGISNTTLPLLQSIVTSSAAHTPALPAPSFVQNRFYPGTNHEGPLRKYCRQNGIIFQSFWTLSGNPGLLKSKVVNEVAEALEGKVLEGEEKAVALYGLVIGLGSVSVLNGTTSEGRMRGDLVALSMLEGLMVGEWKGKWEGWMREFRGEIREVIGEGE